MCSIADALNPNCSVTIFPLFSFLTRKLHSHWITHLSVLLTASYMLPSVFLLCANMTALHLKMPHKLFWCLSDPLEIQWKLAHPQPTPTSLSSGLCHCECYNTHSFRRKDGVFLIFCLLLFLCSELGWQLECCSHCMPQLNPAIDHQYTQRVSLCSHRENNPFVYSHFT